MNHCRMILCCSVADFSPKFKIVLVFFNVALCGIDFSSKKEWKKGLRSILT